MNKKSSAHYQREFRRRLREQGLMKKEVWIRPENARLLTELEKRLREVNGSEQAEGVMSMAGTTNIWTTTTLYSALQEAELFTGGAATVELIDGIEPTLHIVMREFGDLPLFLTVSGEQIIVEAVLWPVSDVKDAAAFNDAVLRTHKYFPLSTISLDTVAEGVDYYHMFGALSSASILANVIFEIEVLARNVIQATEAYSPFFLKDDQV